MNSERGRRELGGLSRHKTACEETYDMQERVYMQQQSADGRAYVHIRSWMRI